MSLWNKILQVNFLLSTKIDPWPGWLKIIFFRLRDPEVGKYQKENLKLSMPRFNFGASRSLNLKKNTSNPYQSQSLKFSGVSTDPIYASNFKHDVDILTLHPYA